MKRTIAFVGPAHVSGTWKGCRDAVLDCNHQFFLLPTDPHEVGDSVNCTQCDPPAPKKDLTPFARGLR